jgi:hypothetical protein
MVTDNSVTDSFVMVPLGIVIGLALGVGRAALVSEEKATSNIQHSTSNVEVADAHFNVGR